MRRLLESLHQGLAAKSSSNMPLSLGNTTWPSTCHRFVSDKPWKLHLAQSAARINARTCRNTVDRPDVLLSEQRCGVSKLCSVVVHITPSTSPTRVFTDRFGASVEYNNRLHMWSLEVLAGLLHVMHRSLTNVTNDMNQRVRLLTEQRHVSSSHSCGWMNNDSTNVSVRIGWQIDVPQ
jgi:hypothetical protein